MSRLIAIDLGAHQVKVCTYKQAGRQYVLDARHAQRVPQDGHPPSLEHRMVALDALLDEHPKLKAGGGDVVVSALPAHDTSFRRVTMPFSDRAQIEKSLPFAVESEVPFELDDMVLGWRVLSQRGQTDIMAALARRETVSDWLAGLAERGLDPASLHVDGDVYSRWGAIEAGPFVGPDVEPAKPPLVAIVDVGHLDTVISVVRNGVVQFSRSVNVAGWNFTRAIQQALECSWADAEAYKHGSAVVDADVTDPGRPRHSGYAQLPPAAREAVDASIGLLLAEVRSTLIRAEDTLGGEVVELRLCGGSARIDELWDYFASDLGVPVAPAKDPMGLPCPPAFALSQALAGVSIQGQAAVDLRVGPLAYRGGGDWVRSALFYGAIGVVSFLLVATPLTAWRYVSMTLEQRAADAMVLEIFTETFPEIPPAQVEKPSMAEAMMREQTADMVSRAEVLGAPTSIPPTLDVLFELTSAFPDPNEVDVTVKDLTITRETVSFNAETMGFAGSAAVEEKLQAHPRFASAEKGQETKQSNGVVKFPITIDLTGAAPDEEG